MNKEANIRWDRGRKRRLLSCVGATAALLILASVAYACILPSGSLLVCQPASRTYVNGKQCSRISGSGSQAGMARVGNEGSGISVKASNFSRRPHTIHFRIPGSRAPCQRHDGRNAISLLGVDAQGQPNTVPGPSFYRQVRTPAVASVGRAQVCVQDEDNIIVQAVSVAVV